MSQDFHIGNGSYLNLQASNVVKLQEQLIVYTEDGPITLNVDVSADFVKIDKKYHEIFFNVLSAKYLNKVAYGDNPFSECRPVVKRKWWQFWRTRYVESLKS